MDSSVAPIVRVKGIRKAYGRFEALKGVDLEVQRGEVFALLGPNGAGKTTLVEILEGYRSRTSGEASVLGVDPAHGSRAWRARIGMVLQATTVFDQLTPAEAVAEFARYYANPLDASDVLALVGLSDRRDVRMRKLSGGQKRRADLALGLVGNPELIFLDEPTTGLDPEGRRQLWEVIRRMAALNKTVVLTTHYLDEAEQLASRVGVIVAGEMVALGTPRDLAGRDRAEAIVACDLPPSLRARALPTLSGVSSLTADRLTVRTTAPTAVVQALAAWGAVAGMAELPALSVTRPSLEDTYLALVQAHSAAAVQEVA